MVTLPTNPGIYTGNTKLLKSIYKQELKLYNGYEEHKRNIIKAIQASFLKINQLILNKI